MKRGLKIINISYDIYTDKDIRVKGDLLPKFLSTKVLDVTNDNGTFNIAVQLTNLTVDNPNEIPTIKFEVDPLLYNLDLGYSDTDKGNEENKIYNHTINTIGSVNNNFIEHINNYYFDYKLNAYIFSFKYSSFKELHKYQNPTGQEDILNIRGNKITFSVDIKENGSDNITTYSDFCYIKQNRANLSDDIFFIENVNGIPTNLQNNKSIVLHNGIKNCNPNSERLFEHTSKIFLGDENHHKLNILELKSSNDKLVPYIIDDSHEDGYLTLISKIKYSDNTVYNNISEYTKDPVTYKAVFEVICNYNNISIKRIFSINIIFYNTGVIKNTQLIPKLYNGLYKATTVGGRDPIIVSRKCYDESSFNNDPNNLTTKYGEDVPVLVEYCPDIIKNINIIRHKDNEGKYYINNFNYLLDITFDRRILLNSNNTSDILILRQLESGNKLLYTIYDKFEVSFDRDPEKLLIYPKSREKTIKVKSRGVTKENSVTIKYAIECVATNYFNGMLSLEVVDSTDSDYDYLINIKLADGELPTGTSKLKITQVSTNNSKVVDITINSIGLSISADPSEVVLNNITKKKDIKIMSYGLLGNKTDWEIINKPTIGGYSDVYQIYSGISIINENASYVFDNENLLGGNSISDESGLIGGKVSYVLSTTTNKNENSSYDTLTVKLNRVPITPYLLTNIDLSQDIKQLDLNDNTNNSSNKKVDEVISVTIDNSNYYNISLENLDNYLTYIDELGCMVYACDLGVTDRNYNEITKNVISTFSNKLSQIIDILDNNISIRPSEASIEPLSVDINPDEEPGYNIDPDNPNEGDSNPDDNNSGGNIDLGGDINSGSGELGGGSDILPDGPGFEPGPDDESVTDAETYPTYWYVAAPKLEFITNPRSHIGSVKNEQGEVYSFSDLYNDEPNSLIYGEIETNPKLLQSFESGTYLFTGVDESIIKIENPAILDNEPDQKTNFIYLVQAQSKKVLALKNMRCNAENIYIDVRLSLANLLGGNSINVNKPIHLDNSGIELTVKSTIYNGPNLIGTYKGNELYTEYLVINGDLNITLTSTNDNEEQAALGSSIYKYNITKGSDYSGSATIRVTSYYSYLINEVEYIRSESQLIKLN